MTMLRQGHLEARRLISGVRPPILDESGIVAAIAHLVSEERRQKGPKIEFHSDVAFDRLVPILENAIYRIVQEGLTNACRHSKSPRVRIELVAARRHAQDQGAGLGTGLRPRAGRSGPFRPGRDSAAGKIARRQRQRGKRAGTRNVPDGGIAVGAGKNRCLRHSPADRNSDVASCSAASIPRNEETRTKEAGFF